VFIRKTARAFTTIKLIHVFAISLVIGSIAIVDSRLLGLASTRRLRRTRPGTAASAPEDVGQSGF
jgi:hypothetical protein